MQVRLESDIARDFRVEKVAGMFDVPVAGKSSLAFDVPVPPTSGPGSDWRIGVVVGKSGDGKSSVGRRYPGLRFIEPGSIAWPDAAAVVSAFPEGLDIKAITGTLSAVGFSSPPAWLLPYRALSGGQRMRCDLARALLTDTSGGDTPGAVGFDEFTSVVDRQVAQVIAHAAQKAVREGRVPVKRLVLFTCHYDVLAWLQPDWVLDMSKRQLARGWLPPGSMEHRRFRGLVPPRPPIRFSVHRIDAHTRARLWPAFARHHYLSAALHRAARCYAAVVSIDGAPPEAVGFCGTLTNAGHVGRRRVTRLVVLPDYQGLGVGLRLLDAVAAAESATHRLSIRTSHPALVHALERRPVWRLTDVCRTGTRHRGGGGVLAQAGSLGRCVATFQYRPQPQA